MATSNRRLAAGVSAALVAGLIAVGVPQADAAITTVVASADTYVNQSAPTTNQGASTSLAVYGTPIVQSYLRFAVPAAPAGQEVASAKLRLRTTTLASAGTADTVSVRTANNGWSEASTLYANRPTLGSTLGSLTAPNAVNTAYEITLDPAAVQTANGTDLALALTGNGTDSFWFSARESSTPANRPTLVVDFASTTPPDTTKPTAPTALAANVDGSNVSLTWTAATDNTAVVGYQVHRSAVAGFTPSPATLIASPSTTSYSEARPAGTWYYRVTASDAANNVSDPSDEATATVAASPVGPPVVVSGTADTYVNQSAPTTNQGASTSLAVYGTPIVQSYLRFAVPAAPAGQEVASAKLRLRTTTLASAGTVDTVSVRTANNGWSEAGTLYANRPTLGSTLGSLTAPNAVNTAYEITLDPAAVQTANGADLSLALTGNGTDSFWFSARESSTPANRPTLVVQFTAAPVGSTAVVMAAGDMVCPPGTASSAIRCRHPEVASSMVAAAAPDRFIAIGDTEQGQARIADYYRPGGYQDTYGAIKAITLPVVGNHEYTDPAGPAQGYFDYFYGPGISNGPFGTRPDGYYATTIGSWRFIALNSECAPDAANTMTMVAGGCGVGSPQYAWLQSQLATSPACTLVAYHRPRWTTGQSHAPYTGMAPMWDLMSAAGVDVVLNGHVHSTEIFKQIGVSGGTTTAPVQDQSGIREFVSGIGGDSLRTFGSPSGQMFDALEARNASAFGALKLTLKPTSYDWAMVPIPGMSFTNSGTTGEFAGATSCH